MAERNEKILRDLTNKVRDLKQAKKLLRAVASTLFAQINQRVFSEGKLSSGAAPAPYSTKPMYASTAISSKLSPLGKNGKSTFKDGKKKKSRYLPDGYRELKEKMGRKNRWDFTGQLKKAFTFSPEGDGFVIGFAGTGRLTATKKTTDTTHGDIVEGQEDKYGDIFSLSKSEEARMDEIINEQLDLILK